MEDRGYHDLHYRHHDRGHVLHRHDFRGLHLHCKLG